MIKKLPLTFLLICCFAVNSSAIGPMMQLIAGGCIGADCDANNATFIWECNSETVGDTNFCPYGCSDGDTSATNDGAAISGGSCIFDDTSENDGDDNYKFDVNADIFDDAVGTAFIRGLIDTQIDETRLWSVEADGSDAIIVRSKNTDEVYVSFASEGEVTRNALTVNSKVPAGTEVILRIRWRVGVYSPNLDITVFNTSMVQQDYASNDTDLVAWTDQAGAADFLLGPNVANPTSYDFNIRYIHVYKEWRDTDPNA